MNFFLKIYKLPIFLQFLRLTKIFTKNKYSRSRQWSKPIIYVGILINIILIFYMQIFCYHYTYSFNFFFFLIIFFFIFPIKVSTFNLMFRVFGRYYVPEYLWF